MTWVVKSESDTDRVWVEMTHEGEATGGVHIEELPSNTPLVIPPRPMLKGEEEVVAYPQPRPHRPFAAGLAGGALAGLVVEVVAHLVR